MKRREGKIPLLLLVIITLITILLMFFELNSKHRVKAEFFEEKIAAAELTQRCFDEIKQASDNLNIPIDRINDPNETGLIGIQYSPITAERGDLNAKLTSTNPNLAALIAKLIKATRIEKGDKVAVSLTGSLPGLNIAVLSTLEILELKPIIITAAGSSMWGANYPQFTYLDMEQVLYEKGLWGFKTSAASIGGEDDMGRGLSPEGREYLMAAIQRNNIDFLAVENLDDAIRKRMDIYRSFGDIKLFINIGEHNTSWIGIDPGYGLIQSGQVKQGKGLIARFSRTGVPVINLDHISQLAEKYGLPNAPIPLPDIGKGRLYYEHIYSVTQAVISLVILVLIIFVVLRFDIEHYFRKDKK
jgi:poly-gamma-glutamate system protein